MKALTSLFTALFLFLVVACEKSDNKYGFGKPVKVFEGETVSIANNSLSISAIEITDSRCPKNAVCVWQGYATIKLNLSSSTDTVKNVSLCTGGCNVASLDTTKIVTIDHKNYTIRLNDIGKENDKKYARVVITPN
ncbi:MAG: hypothetical protein EOO07_21330 [Chitinophagaceae bacterium]|nr:MAG: hypothetical protein EOO07_21330 [Chitinophagaceae bacterium]